MDLKIAGLAELVSKATQFISVESYVKTLFSVKPELHDELKKLTSIITRAQADAVLDIIYQEKTNE